MSCQTDFTRTSTTRVLTEMHSTGRIEANP
jgi:hypothetical protein